MHGQHHLLIYLRFGSVVGEFYVPKLLVMALGDAPPIFLWGRQGQSQETGLVTSSETIIRFLLEWRLL